MTRTSKMQLSQKQKTTLRKMAKAATPGPWQVFDDPGDEWIGLSDSVPDGAYGPGGIICNAPHDFDLSINEWPANSAFIAAAHPTAVLGLLDEIDALRKALMAKQ